MEYLFLSLSLILAGGLASLLLRRHFVLMKGGFACLFAAGAATGLAFAWNTLTSGSPVSLAATWLNLAPLSFTVDGLGAFFLLPIFLVSLATALYSLHYMDNPEKNRRTGANYFFFTILVAAMALVVTAADFLTLALSWELMSLSSFFLVVFDFENKKTRAAGYVYLLFAQAGALLLFAAIGLIYASTGSFTFQAAGKLPAAVTYTAFLLAFLGFGSKAGIMPLHIWLPRAHPAAPSHVSAIMSGVMIKMGIYGILRFYQLLQPTDPLCAEAVIGVGAVTGVLGVVQAMGQHDLKKLLAYHSVENIGIIVLGIGAGMLGSATGRPLMAALGFGGAIFHVLNHALFKSLLFMGAGSVLHRTGTAAIEAQGGLLKRMPVTGWTFLAGSLAICGLPPFNGFASEFLIYAAGFSGSRMNEAPLLLSVLAIVSLAAIGGLAVACFTKVVGIVFLGEPRTAHARQAHECGGAMQGAMLLVAALCAAIGLAPPPAIRAALAAARTLGDLPAAAPGITALANRISMGSALFLGVAALVYLLRQLLLFRKKPAASPTWGCGFSRPTARIQYSGTSFAAPVINFYQPLAPVRQRYTGLHGLFPESARFKSEVEDLALLAAAKWLAGPVQRLTNRLRWLQHGKIQLYIAYIVAALAAMLIWLVTG